nr:O-antigen ligase family protein [Sphingomonas sp. CFBP 13728]
MIVVFLGGGASRTDVQSLALLRPLALLVMAYSLFKMRLDDVRRFPVAFALLGSAVLLTVLHLVPLPPALWTALPGRDLIAEIDRASGIGAIWRPLTMVPAMTRNALYSLTVPMAVLLLAVRLDDRERAMLVPVFILFGVASGLLGLVQVAGNTGLPFLYAQTTMGTANGLFANRNHGGVLLACMLPLLAAYAIGRSNSRDGQRTLWLVCAITIFLVALVLVIGSRAGLLCTLLAILLSPFLALDRLVGAPRATRRLAMLVYAGGCACLVLLGLIFVLAARAESLRRLLASDATGDRRLQVWEPVIAMTRQYFPFGSGIGSYIKVFQANEPRDVLTLNYSNHAHNDWLEVGMTAGLPGLAILLATVTAVVILGWRAWRRGGQPNPLLARTATIVLLLLGLASIGDYPLRVPSMMAFFVIAFLWLEARPAPEQASDGDEHRRRCRRR